MRVVSQPEPLAMQGGKPVRDVLLPYGRHFVTEEDVAAVAEVLRSEWLTTGRKIEEFEHAVADFVGAPYAVAFSSGTAALHGACFAAGLKARDEVITSPLTFCATVNAVLYQGATPVFADVSADTLNLDPVAVEEKINPKTRAVLPVDYAGHPVDLDVLLELAERNRLTLIEDASHALGASYKRRRIGGFGHMTVFSFHPVKHVAAGEGGMVLSSDSELAKKLRAFRNHGISTDARWRQERGQWHYEMTELGNNYRLSDIHAALGLSQLKRLEENLAQRREIARRYAESFATLDEVIVPAERSDAEHAWHLFPIRLRLELLGGDRDEIIRALRAENVGATVHYLPVYRHSYYRERFPQIQPCLNSERAFEQLVTLPMFHAMTAEDVADVIHAVHKVIAAFRV